MHQTIPVLDMEPYITGSQRDKQHFIQQLHDACRQVGFFYLANHTIEPACMSSVLDLSRDFFNLPQIENDKIDIKYSKCCRGYGRLEAEKTRGIGDFKETYDLGPECILHPERHNKKYYALIGPNQWPMSSLLQSSLFKSTMLTYISQMMQLGASIMSAITAALGYPASHFDAFFKPDNDDAHAMLRLLHYPSALSKKLGVGEHVDSGFLAFLLQDNIGGLQILTRENRWIDVPPLEHHFVVNIGEMLQCWSNGVYCATMHRVINHEHQARISAPFFFEPNLSAEIAISHQENNPVIYGDYLRSIFERSFPAVTH